MVPKVIVISRLKFEEYIAQNHNKSSLVHCGAGQSRSAGVAAAILKWMTGSDAQIFDNRKYTPNMRCYRLVLEALMIGG